MFIYSIRASTLKLIALIGVCLTVIFTISALDSNTAVYASVGGKTVNYGGIKTDEDRVNFIEGFGLKIVKEPSEVTEFAMPAELDRVLLGYNEMQKSQGLDISKYTRKRVTHYAYEVTNYDYEGKVYVNLLIYRNRIIACDISSGNPEGFVLPLSKLDTKKLK